MPETAISARARRFATTVLVLGALLAALHAGFGYQLGQRRRVIVATAVASIALLACLRLRADRRVNVALGVVPVILGVYGFELMLDLSRTPPGSAAASAGRPFDARTRAEVMDDLRAQGIDTAGAMMPKLVAEYLHTRHRPGVTVRGETLLTLGGISRARTVLCNEGGEWATYDADEHGFNNPTGIWSEAPLDVVVVGDSYSHGGCVGRDQGFPARIREKYPKTISLGMGGNGPLFELATIREYLHALRPKIVVWAYFRNDLDDLAFEAPLPALRRYLDEPTFSQGLIEKQDRIDEGLRHIGEGLYRTAPRWPQRLGARGLTRRSTPLFLQDLVMGEHNTVASSLLRLDWLRGAQGGEPPVDRPDYDLFQKILVAARAEVGSWGGKLVFLYIPDTIGMNGSETHRSRGRVLSVVKELGIPLIDAHDEFKGRAIATLRYSWRSHLNPEGYALLGRIVNDHLDALR